jgi:hypothetical protein
MAKRTKDFHPGGTPGKLHRERRAAGCLSNKKTQALCADCRYHGCCGLIERGAGAGGRGRVGTETAGLGAAAGLGTAVIPTDVKSPAVSIAFDGSTNPEPKSSFDPSRRALEVRILRISSGLRFTAILSIRCPSRLESPRSGSRYKRRAWTPLGPADNITVVSPWDDAPGDDFALCESGL